MSGAGDNRLAAGTARVGRCSLMNGTMHNRIAIRVSVSGSPYPDAVQTRISVDDRRVVAEAFGSGPAEPPEYLLGPEHRLRAGTDPHEVRLAVADCTEYCRGALYVTIERSGDEVIWRGWSDPARSEVDLPAFRFDAAHYDAEIARAESDLSWEWRDAFTCRTSIRAIPGPPRPGFSSSP